MPSPSKTLEFESLETENLVIHASANFAEGEPLISINLQEGKKGFFCFNFFTDSKTLLIIAEKLKAIADETKQK